MIYQIPVDQITGLGKYGLALSCTAVSDLAESDLARYAPPYRREVNESKIGRWKSTPSCIVIRQHLPFVQGRLGERVRGEGEWKSDIWCPKRRPVRYFQCEE